MNAHATISNAPYRTKLTARDFWMLAEGGAFEGFVKVGLIEGELWAMDESIAGTPGC